MKRRSPKLAVGKVAAAGECEGTIVASGSVHNYEHKTLKVRNIQQVKLEVLFTLYCSFVNYVWSLNWVKV
jgi:hypothetical protein